MEIRSMHFVSRVRQRLDDTELQRNLQRTRGRNAAARLASLYASTRAGGAAAPQADAAPAKPVLSAWERWEMGSVGGDPSRTTAAGRMAAARATLPPAPPPPTVPAGVAQTELRRLRNEAEAEGKATGHAEGWAAGHAEGHIAGLATGLAEVEAESVAYTVLRAHGIDRGPQSATYLAGWADAVIEAENDVMAHDVGGKLPGSRSDIAKSVLGRVTAASKGILEITHPPGFGGKISAVEADPRVNPAASYAGPERPVRSVDGPVMAGP